MATVSGSVLKAFTFNGTTNFVFDEGNPFQVSAKGHVLVVSASGGFSASLYAIGDVVVGYDCGPLGIQNIASITPYGTGSTLPSEGATGGQWSYKVGDAGSGEAGSNLIALNGLDFQWFFDPDAPVAPSLLGAEIAVSGGDGFAAATGEVVNVVENYGNTGGFGNQNLMQIYGLATDAAHGGTWAKAGGITIPVAPVNESFAGDVNVLLIGNSITSQQNAEPVAAFEAQYPNASNVTVTNKGVSGSATVDWLPGDESGNLSNAIADGIAAGSTVANIMLGTNDAFHGVEVSEIVANLTAIVAALLDGIPTLRSVVLCEDPYRSDNPALNVLLRDYWAAYPSVPRAQMGVSTELTHFAFIQANPSLLADGLHPGNGPGKAEVRYTWQMSLADAISPPAPSGNALLGAGFF